MNGIEAGKLIYQVQADMTAMRKQLDGMEKMASASAKKTSSSILDIAPPAIAAAASLAGIAAAGYKCIQVASDLEEQTAKFNTAFGEQQQLAESWAETLVNSYAMSTREAKQNLAAMMDLLEPMGMNAKAAASMSFEVTKLAADLGSFNNLPTAQVMGDIQSALVGNFETMKKYGVVLNETVTNEEARRLGIIKGKETLTASQRAEVAYQLILKGSKNAIGDMARTSDSYANTQKKMKAGLEDFAATMGSNFLPAITSGASALSTFIKFLNDAVKAGNAMGTSLTDFIPIMGNIMATQRQLAAKQEEDMQKTISRNDALIRMKQLELRDMKGYSAYLDEFNRKKQAGAAATKTYTEAERQAYAKLIEDRKKMEYDLLKGTYEGLGMKEEAFKLEYNRAIEEAKKIGVGREKVDALYAVKRQQMQAQEISEFNSHFGQMTSFASNAVGQLGQIFEMGTRARMQRAENEYNKNLEIISMQYEAEKANIENTITDKKERDAALKALDEKRAREEKLITEQAEKTKRKLARESAKKQKAIAITSAIINAAQGSVAAFAGGVQTIPVPIYAGMILGGVMASIVTALGAAQAAMIASQPLPEAAEGIYAESPYIGGEAGPEVAFPLSSDRGKRAMALMAEQLLAAIEDKIGRGQSKSSATIAPAGSETVTYHRVAPIDIQYTLDEITRASQDGRLLIADRAVRKM